MTLKERLVLYIDIRRAIIDIYSNYKSYLTISK